MRVAALRVAAVKSLQHNTTMRHTASAPQAQLLSPKICRTAWSVVPTTLRIVYTSRTHQSATSPCPDSGIGLSTTDRQSGRILLVLPWRHTGYRPLQDAASAQAPPGMQDTCPSSPTQSHNAHYLA